MAFVQLLTFLDTPLIFGDGFGSFAFYDDLHARLFDLIRVALGVEG